LKLTIDGKQVTAKPGQTVLDVALDNNIHIPHLCNHPALPAFGACRMCVVEIEGMRGYPTSCTTPAQDGMVVNTNTEKINELRRNILALIVLEHPSACLVCARRELCEQYRPDAEKVGRTTGCHTCNNKEVCEVRQLSEDLGLTELPVPPSYHLRPIERCEPFIDRDLNLCILCGRCVRICKHLHGKAVIDFTNRSSKTQIGQAFGRGLLEAGCTFCGACVDVCPTGSLADRYAKWYGKSDSTTQSTCIFCGAACAINLGSKNGKVITAEAVNQNVPVCVLGRFAMPEFLNGTDRFRAPHIRFGDVLRESEWNDTLQSCRKKLEGHTGDKFAFVCDTTSTLEDRFIFKKFTNEVMKSENYIEITPDQKGISKTTLPKGVKAAIITGSFLDVAELDRLEVLIVQDIYPTEASRLADIIFPAAVFAETEGTITDLTGDKRPLHKAAEPPGQARPEWNIICGLAKRFDAKGFDYKSTDQITKELNISKPQLLTEPKQAPEAAKDLKLRRIYFRGHRIDERVCGLRQLPIKEQIAAEPPIAEGKGLFEILKKQEIAPNVHEIIVKAPEVAKKARPGQFVIVMVDEKSERVPYTLCDWDTEKGTITLVVQEKGQSSRKLVLQNAGDRLAHVAGPLGVPLEIKNYGTVALTAGCYGIGAIVPIARELKQAGNKIISIAEARSSYLAYYQDKLKALSDEFIQTTIDGSQNIRGHAVDTLIDKLKKGEKVDLCIAVGCPFMMMITAQETKPYEVKTLAALNPIMLDGTGMCGACRLTVAGEMKFACVDGPFFDAHLVDWDEVRDRRVAYSADEIHSLSKTEGVLPPHEHKCMVTAAKK
jgi:NADH dehydrogenase/NADH:ubiquinone oxidoreductase subunit G/NAD(P)H-flavin reductase